MAYIYTFIGARLAPTIATSQPISLPAGATGALIQVLSQNARISFDDTTPAGVSSGFQIKAGDPARYYPLGGGAHFSMQQEAATASVYIQPVRLDWVEP